MRFFKDISLAVVSGFLVICLFEIGLRVTGTKYESSLYESDPVLYMTFRPHARGWEAKEGENFIRINSHGMRDRERSLQPAPGTIRVALLGDSMMVGSEVPLDKTVGQVLERQLDAALAPSGHSIEVLNFAVGGYTLSQEYLALRKRVWAFRPNIVLLVLSPTSVPSCNRRLFPADIPYFLVREGKLVPDPHNHPPAGSDPGARRRHAVLGDLMNEFRLLQMIRKATQDGIPHEIAKLEGTKHAHNDNIVDMWFRPPDTYDKRAAWDVAEGLLDQMAKDSRVHGAEFWISIVGHEIEETRDPQKRLEFLTANHLSDFHYSESRLQLFATTHRIGFIPLENELLEYSQQHEISTRGFFNTAPDRGHWNETGHAAAAGVFADALLRNSTQLGHRPAVPNSTAITAERSTTSQLTQGTTKNHQVEANGDLHTHLAEPKKIPAQLQ